MILFRKESVEGKYHVKIKSTVISIYVLQNELADSIIYNIPTT